MLRVAMIDIVRDTALIISPATDADRACRVIARINLVRMADTDFADLVAGRITIIDCIKRASGTIAQPGDQNKQASLDTPAGLNEIQNED